MFWNQMSPEVETGTCGSIARHNSHQARYVAFWPASVSTDMADCWPVLGNFLLILAECGIPQTKTLSETRIIPRILTEWCFPVGRSFQDIYLPHSSGASLPMGLGEICLKVQKAPSSNGGITVICHKIKPYSSRRTG